MIHSKMIETTKRAVAVTTLLPPGSTGVETNKQTRGWTKSDQLTLAGQDCQFVADVVLKVAALVNWL